MSSSAPGTVSCVFRGCTPWSFCASALEGRGRLSAPPCSFVGSLVLVPLCSGCFPEGTRRKLNLPFVDGSAGSRAVGADGGRTG